MLFKCLVLFPVAPGPAAGMARHGPIVGLIQFKNIVELIYFSTSFHCSLSMFRKLYWQSRLERNIFASNLDGTNRMLVTNNQAWFVTIALYPQKG